MNNLVSSHDLYSDEDMYDPFYFTCTVLQHINSLKFYPFFGKLRVFYWSTEMSVLTLRPFSTTAPHPPPPWGVSERSLSSDHVSDFPVAERMTERVILQSWAPSFIQEFLSP